MSNRRRPRNPQKIWGHLAPFIDHTRQTPTPHVDEILQQAHKTVKAAGQAIANDIADMTDLGMTLCAHLETDTGITDLYSHVVNPLHWTCFSCVPNSTPTCDGCQKPGHHTRSVISRYRPHCPEHSDTPGPSHTVVALVCPTCYGT